MCELIENAVSEPSYTHKSTKVVRTWYMLVIHNAMAHAWPSSYVVSCTLKPLLVPAGKIIFLNTTSLFRPFLPSTTMSSLEPILAIYECFAEKHNLPLSMSGSSVASPTLLACASPICVKLLSAKVLPKSYTSATTKPCHKMNAVTYRPFNVRSDSFPFTRWPIPVPLTLRPFSILFLILSSVPFTVCGNSSSTPCFRASFTRSACLLSENTGSCHLPVTGCLCALNGLGNANALSCEGIWSADAADDPWEGVLDGGTEVVDGERMAWGG